MKIFEKIVAAVFWLQIAVSPVIVSLFLGFIVHVNYPTPLGWVASIAIVALGIIGGIWLANWAAKKYGTTEFIARASASPELDHLEEKEN
jgi:drug/metabolite transporter (DMT)-like permease